MKTVIGLDYGTQAARGVLVDAESGQVLASHSFRYPHGNTVEGLACLEDYEQALGELLFAVTPPEYRKTVEGICVDATSLTLVCVDQDGRALSRLPELSDRPHAQVKLWKYHQAEPYAREALSLARKLGEPFLERTGGSISSEWTMPKLLEIRDGDPLCYERMDYALDLCEYLTFRLTGRVVRSMGSMCYKGLWSQELGFPSGGFLNGLRPGFSGEYRRRLRGPVLRPGERAGNLKPELCYRFGLKESVAVATGLLDGHTALAALGAVKPGDAALVVGTSNVLTIQSSALHRVEGICGVALDGQVPGLYGIDAGQSGTGDMLEWFVRLLGGRVQEEAGQRGISSHQVLTEQIRRPWENPVTAVDWWNGSRNVPCDLGLRGILAGLSLDTGPEEIYLALLQAMACGTREILEACKKQGVVVKRMLAAGGITGKNPLLMQEYANLLNGPVLVGKVEEGPALGSALFAAVAAGIYGTAAEAYGHMGVREFVRYEPDPEHREAYEALYWRNHRLRR